MTRLDENALLRSQLAELEVSLQALKEENAMLRDERRIDNEDLAQAYDFARNKGEALERQAVVVFMRADPEWPACPQCRDAALYVTANAIERGEHRRGEEA